VVLESPHTRFSAAELGNLAEASEWKQQKEGARISSLRASSSSEEAISVELSLTSDHIEWTTVIVFSYQEADAWIGIRTARESSRPISILPPARKPIIVREILKRFGGATDGALTVKEEPHRLGNNDIRLATRIISGEARCYLPVIYISVGFDGGYTVDANSLAHDLSGMAHVVVEPNRPFSRRLQIEVGSENVYGGTVGIYWPQSGGRRSFFLGPVFDDPQEVKRAIIDEVRTALLNRRPLTRCALSSVQEALSRQKYNELKSSGSRELEKYVELFDVEIKAKSDQLEDAEREIDRLKAEIRRVEEQVGVRNMVMLQAGAEQELYAGELTEIVRDALNAEVSRVQRDSRREHILNAILNSTPTDDILSSKREELKGVLRDYRHMDNRTRRSLEAFGFAIGEDGKHYKLTLERTTDTHLHFPRAAVIGEVVSTPRVILQSGYFDLSSEIIPIPPQSNPAPAHNSPARPRSV
jgi:hypothetical protein